MREIEKEVRLKICIPIFMLIYCILLFILKSNVFLQSLINKLLSLYGMFFGFLSLLNTYRKSENYEKNYWLFISLSILSYILGNLFYFYYKIILKFKELILEWFNLFYLLQYILLIVGILFLTFQKRGRLAGLRLLFDILIVFVLSGVAIWYYYIEPIFIRKKLSLFSTIILIFHSAASISILFVLIDFSFISCEVFPSNVAKLNIFGFFLGSISNIIYLCTQINYIFIHTKFLYPIWTLSVLIFALAGKVFENITFVSKEKNRKIIIKILISNFIMMTLLMIIFHRIYFKDILGFFIVIIFMNIRQILIFYENEQFCKEVQKESKIDFLTGLYNRRYIHEKSKEFFEKFELAKNQISVLMIDIDYFKKVNDTYGHKVGDIVLKKVSSIMKNNIRKDDILVRFGGEEFVCFLPSTDREIAKIISERLRSKIENHQFKVNAQMFSITVSIGICQKNYIKKREDINEMVIKADEALYKAKQLGRNCICCEK